MDVIDVSNFLTEDNYRQYQTFHYNNKVIMLAEKNDTNKDVFEKEIIDK